MKLRRWPGMPNSKFSLFIAFIGLYITLVMVSYLITTTVDNKKPINSNVQVLDQTVHKENPKDGSQEKVPNEALPESDKNNNEDQPVETKKAPAGEVEKEQGAESAPEISKLSRTLKDAADVSGYTPFDTPVLWIGYITNNVDDRGFIKENLNFIIPLFSLVPNFGWISNVRLDEVEKTRDFKDLNDEDKIVIRRAYLKGQGILGQMDKEKPMITVIGRAPPFYNITMRAEYPNIHRHSSYTVGRAMFETNAIPSSWYPQLNTQIVNELWVPSEWQKDVFEGVGVDPKVVVVREGFETALFKKDESAGSWGRKELFPRCRSDDVIFLMVGKMEERKGLDVLINSFTAEFEASDKVCLIIRSGMRSRDRRKFRRDRGRWYVVGVYSGDNLIKAYQRADVFVLATHGEGWGRPVMEAMAGGLPVIVPLWSGLTEFVKPEYSLPINVTELEPAFSSDKNFIEINENNEDHMWAKVDMERLQGKLRWCLKHRDELKGIGSKAKDEMFKTYTREKIAVEAALRLSQISKEVESKRRTDGLLAENNSFDNNDAR